MKRERRGGARKGAGRKPLRDGERRVTFSLRLLPATRLHLETLADGNDVTITGMIEDLVEEAWRASPECWKP